MAEQVVTPGAIDRCFGECDLPTPGNTSAYISKNLNGPSSKFVKVAKGYRLHRNYKDEIASRLGANGQLFK